MTMKTWMVAAFAAVVLVGCGSGQRSGSTTQAQAVVVTPTLEGPIGERRITCTDLDPALNRLYTDIISFKDVTFPYVLSFSDTDTVPGPLTAVLTFSSAKEFGWTANQGVDYVLVGDAGSLDTFVYKYDPEAIAGAQVVAPHESDVLYVKLCYDPDVEEGCTFTFGYWKTHTKYGPAKKADPTWDQIGDPKAVQFFSSGMTYYGVLWTPVAGNPYFILAHQFIAAKLNLLAGAAPGDVATAMTQAETLLTGLTLADAFAQRDELVRLGGLLAAFNEGETGPGHCAE
jgi:hypothetical protein